MIIVGQIWILFLALLGNMLTITETINLIGLYIGHALIKQWKK